MNKIPGLDSDSNPAEHAVSLEELLSPRESILRVLCTSLSKQDVLIHKLIPPGAQMTFVGHSRKANTLERRAAGPVRVFPSFSAGKGCSHPKVASCEMVWSSHLS